ncbi:MAG: GNAT family N-acetyltransferase [Christensenellales bacterium]|jgi:predicted GNAT family N-acyltransferase
MIKAYFLMGDQDISVPLDIRTKVFVEEQGFSQELQHDEMDKKAVHVVIEDDGFPCATGRLFFDDGLWHIGRMAVLKERRGNRYGDLMIRMLAEKAFRAGVEEIHIGAQAYALGFYEKLGFLICGEEYAEEGVAHLPMVLTVSRAQEVLFGHSGCGGCGEKSAAGCEGCGGCSGR